MSLRNHLSSASLLALTALAAASAGCVTFGQTIRGSGETASEVRQVSGFSRVSVTNQGDLKIELGDSESLVVEADANLLPHLLTEVRGDTLVLGTRPRNASLRPRRPIRYYLTVRSLEAVETLSSGDIRADRLEAPRFSVRSASSGDITIGELRAGELRVELSSSGDAAISAGEVGRLELDASSSGDFDGEGLRCREARVSLSSSGDARIQVESELSARLSSSGSLVYSGDPRVEARETSSGRVRKRD